MFSATPSDPVFWGPLVPSLGLICSPRGNSSYADASHPNAVAPGRRPRVTPNPALVMRDGQPLLAIGCPGGDVQTQGMLQVLLNMLHFGMTPQQSIEAPRAWSWSFPSSFTPHKYQRGRVDIESRVPESTSDELRELGHDVQVQDEWCRNGRTTHGCSVHTVVVNPANGVLIGGSDPRCAGAAVGW
jgi:gamma-glutamyltranspeptidase/glutathione hydrolase